MNASIQTMLDLMNSVNQTPENGVEKSLLDESVHHAKFNFPNRALNSFVRHNITTISELISYDRDKLRALRYMGQGTVSQVDECLAKHNLRLGMPVSEIVGNKNNPLEKLYALKAQIEFAINLLKSLK